MVKKDPWMTNEILEIIIDKDEAFHRAKRNKTEANMNEARLFKNRAKSVGHKARASYIKDRLHQHDGNSKKIRDDISKLISTKKKNTGKINLNDSTGNPLPEKEVADHINVFLTSIGPNLAKMT